MDKTKSKSKADENGFQTETSEFYILAKNKFRKNLDFSCLSSLTTGIFDQNPSR